MADVSIAYTTSNVSGQTAILAGRDQTITGLHTFDRDPSAPFAVTAASAVVANLDADKVDGYEASGLGRLNASNTFTDAAPIILSNASGGVRERGRSFQLGEYQAVTHADSNFTGDGTDANWVVEAGDQQTFSWTVVGKVLFVALTVAGSTVANTPAELWIPVPNSFTVNGNVGGAFYFSDNGTAGVGRWYAVNGGNVIRFAKQSGTWTNSTNNTTVQASVIIPIN